ncbi:hypothetical protein [Aneurinibacillus soli]|nr:hypothetical protein [Aneurinibacillus soli]
MKTSGIGRTTLYRYINERIDKK